MNRFSALCSKALALAFAFGACSSSGPSPTLPLNPNFAATCAPGEPSPLGSVPIAVRKLALPEGLPESALTTMVQGTGDRWYLVYQEGRVFSIDQFEQDHDPLLYADVRDRVHFGNSIEPGLVGMAPPRAAADGTAYTYLYYTAESTSSAIQMSARLSRFRHEGGSLALSSEEILLEYDKDAPYHHAGTLMWGPDDYLYVSVGDNWWNHLHLSSPYSQDPSTLQGSLLRLDVRQTPSYGIPSGNPFADDGNEKTKKLIISDDDDEDGDDEDDDDQGPRPEIYAYGLRNPWKYSFDRESGALWLADVGRSGFEELNLVKAGGNYGWPIWEGSQCNLPELCETVVAEPPFMDFGRVDLACIIGGYVYRGNKIPQLKGKYVFGDCVYGTIWAVDLNDTKSIEVLAQTIATMTTFVEDADGEIYFGDYAGGIFAIEPWDATAVTAVAEKLSETGCFSPSDPTLATTDLHPYEINFPFWSDGLEKSRWIAVPSGDAITAYAATGIDRMRLLNPLGYDFPDGTVFVKNFELDGKFVETRILKRHRLGQWQGYSYEWLDDQSDAFLLHERKSKTLENGQVWVFPSRTDCMACHTWLGSRALGFHPGQLDRMVETAYGFENQLAYFRRIGIVDDDLDQEYDVMPDKSDPTTTPENWVRGYLHANCAMCHQPEGAAVRATFDARYHKTMDEKKLIDEPPKIDAFGVPNARLVAPGDPDRSILLNRIERKDDDRMPFIGNHVRDEEAIAKIREWIESL